MIISASYKTDIPAFYSRWFMNRLDNGFCMMRNPYNRQPIRVDLSPSAVEAIVFWTKNIKPLAKHLGVIKEHGYPFVIQYTVNGYSKSLEHNVVDWEKSAQYIIDISSTYGKRCVVWRYDTIIFSAETPYDFHLMNFERIADRLSGSVDEVVVSFVQMYRKTKINLDKMARESSNPWWDPPVEDKLKLIRELNLIARDRGIALTICSQPELSLEATHSKCIDIARISSVAGKSIYAKATPNRPGCGCAASRDIGDYDTCPHGCVYCYAVRSNELARRRYREHDPDSPYLFTDPKDPSDTSKLEVQIQPKLDI